MSRLTTGCPLRVEISKLFSLQIVIVLTLGCCSSLSCQNRSVVITERAAHDLARRTMLPAGRNLPDMPFNVETALRPGPFYWFSITARVPDDQSPLLGAFAVNKLTGEVWDIVSLKTLGNEDLLSARVGLRPVLHTSQRASAIAPCAP